MKKFLIASALALFTTMSLQAQIDFVVNNSTISNKPGVFPGGTETFGFDFYLGGGFPFTFSSDDLSNDFGSLIISFTKVDPSSTPPTGSGAALFNWTFSPPSTWVGNTKTITMNCSPTAPKYKIYFVDVPIIAASASTNANLGFNVTWTDPGNAPVLDPVNNSTDRATYTITPAPLSLTSFTGKEKSCGEVELKWTTLNEDGVFNYELEHGTDGRSFSTLQTIASKNIKQGAQYTLTVAQQEEQGYYRLKMHDLDKHFSYSPIVKVNQNCINPIKVYPNPGSDIVNVSTLKGTETITILSIDGKLLLEQKATSGINAINISALASGSYSLVITEGEEVRTFKLAKN